MMKEITEKKVPQNIISYLPILTIISLGIGIINLLVYYYPFQLDILTYIDINEILLDTATNLLLVISIVFGIRIAAEIFIYFRHRTLKIVDQNDPRLTFSIRRRTIDISTFIFIAFFTAIFVWVYPHFDGSKYHSLGKEWHLLSLVAYIGIVWVTVILIYARHIIATNYFKVYQFKFMSIFIGAIAVLFWSILISANNAADKIFLSSFGTTIEIGSKRIISNDDYYYIGRTKNYIFFYNAKFEYTDVYQSKDVTIFSLNNKGWKKTLNIYRKEKREQDSIIHKKIIDSISNFKKKADSLSHIKKT